MTSTRISILLATILTLCIHNAFSQNFVYNQKIWSYDVPIENPGAPGTAGGTEVYISTEDSVLIDGLYYHSIYKQESGAFFPDFDSDLEASTSALLNMREDGNGKVFFKYDNEPEFVRYDFSLEVGDDFDMPSYDLPITFTSTQLESIDTFYDLLGEERKRYTFAGDEVWIEGLGDIYRIAPTEMGLAGLYCFKEQGAGHVYGLGNDEACVYVPVSNDEIIQNYNIRISPNPIDDLFTIDTPFSLEGADIHIYNSEGKEMKFETINNNQIDSSEWATGIYFLSIRKGDNYWSEKMMK